MGKIVNEDITIDYRIKQDELEQKDYRKIAYTQSKKMYIKTVINTTDSIIQSFIHKHKDYEFIIPLAPIPCLVQNGEICFGEVGYVYPIKVNSEHGIQAKITDIAMINIVIDYDWFTSIVDRLTVKHGALKYFKYTDVLKSMISTFYEIFKTDFELKEDMLDSIAEDIAFEIIRSNTQAFDEDKFKPRVYHKGLQVVCDYINNNYSEPMTIDNLAKMSGMSKYYFISSFKEFTGLTPMEYVIRFRLSKAKFYLEFSDYKIQDIAQKVGFNSTTAFTHTFTRYIGVTPSQYIKTLNKSEDKLGTIKLNIK